MTDSQNLGYEKYSLLGWSDGGITSMILAAAFPRHIEKMVIWGANAFVTEEDVEAYDRKCYNFFIYVADMKV